MPLTWLGLGSNTLVRDGGVDGVVIITQGALNKVSPLDMQLVRAEAGVASAQLARYTARQGTTGLEFMAGIPGTVGGALAMNAGCFGGETWQYVSAVETINRQGEIKVRPADRFSSELSTCGETMKMNGLWLVIFHYMPGDKEKSLNDIRLLLERRNQYTANGACKLWFCIS